MSAFKNNMVKTCWQIRYFKTDRVRVHKLQVSDFFNHFAANV